MTVANFIHRRRVENTTEKKNPNCPRRRNKAIRDENFPIEKAIETLEHVGIENIFIIEI